MSSTILITWKTLFWSSYEEFRTGVEAVGVCLRLLKVWRLPWEKMNAGVEQTDVLPAAQKKEILFHGLGVWNKEMLMKSWLLHLTRLQNNAKTFQR